MNTLSAEALGSFLNSPDAPPPLLGLLADFNTAWAHIGLAEGGFSNNEGPGGATNYGIRMETYARYLGRPVSVAEVRAMSKTTAFAIYKKFYWDVLELDSVKSDAVATAFFDQAVNRGLGYASVLQRLVGVTADGHVGPNTMKAINAADPKQLIDRMANEARKNYLALAQAHTKFRKFLAGWLARAERLRALKALA